MSIDQLKLLQPSALRRWLVVFFALLAFANLAWALTFPQLTGRIVDQAGIIDIPTQAALEKKLADLEEKSGIQFVVATVKSLEGSDIETYANQLFRNWKLGEEKKNNGVLLLVAPTERKVRIEVGYGLEGTLTDALSKIVIANAVAPRFKAGDFPGGITRGVDDVITILTTDASEWQKRPKVRAEEPAGNSDFYFFLLAVLLMMFVAYMIQKNEAARRGRWVRRGNSRIFIPSAGAATSGWGSGWSGSSSSSSSGSSWGSDSGGFSGGGGSSGGGGASGDW